MPAPAEIDVESQNLVNGLNNNNFIVSSSGNFPTTNSAEEIVTLTASSVQHLDSGLPTDSFKIFFTNANLQNLGLDLSGLNALFPNSARAAAPEQVPARAIQAWSQNWILVSAYDLSGRTFTGNGGANPANGNTIRLLVLRQGSAVITDFQQTINVVVSGTPVNAQTQVGDARQSIGTVGASDGVVLAYVGSGVGGPRFAGNAFPASQVFGTGLPANVFP